MDHLIKENSKMDLKMVTAFIYGRINHVTQAIGLTMNEMVTGFKNGSTTDHMKDNGIEE